MPDQELFKLTLSVGVPLRIMEMERAGGPSDLDISFARDYATVLGEKGDVLQFGSKRKGEVAELMNGLIRAVAVLACCPGGVRLFGLHFTGGRMNEKASAKNWDSCTVEEKLERLRKETQRLRREGEDTLGQLSRHTHDAQGRAVEPVEGVVPRPDPLA